MKKTAGFKTKSISADFFYKFLIILLVVCIVSPGQGEKNYIFENISIPQGLSHPEISYICQDSYGYLWIATLDGLNRYDGFKIKVYKNNPADSTSLPNNLTGAMIEDDDGYLWIGCIGSTIARFDPKNERFKNYRIESGGVSETSNFHHALKDSKGNIWFASTNHGVHKYNKQSDAFEPIPLDTSLETSKWGEVYNIVELRNGNILAADYGNGIKIYNAGRNVFQPFYLKIDYSPDKIASICELPSGDIWFGGNAMLIKYSPVYYTVEEYDIFSRLKNRTNFDVVNGIFPDNDGNLVFAVYSKGLFNLDVKTGDVQRFQFDQSQVNSISSNRIWKMYRDNFGIFWLGHDETGVDKFDPLREPFRFYKLKDHEQSAQITNAVTGIIGNPAGTRLVVGTSSQGIFYFDLRERKYVQPPVSYPKADLDRDDRNIQGVALDKEDQIWFGFNGADLCRVNKNNEVTKFTSPDKGKTVSNTISALKIDLMGHLWLASRHGIEKYDPVKNKFTSLPRIMSRPVSGELREMLDKITCERGALAEILKVGEGSNIEQRFTLDADQKLMVLCLGEGRLVQGNQGIFDYGFLKGRDGTLLWRMDEISRTYYAGGGYKNRLAVGVLSLKKGQYNINYVSDVGHSYDNWNVLSPPDSNWWGIQVFVINDTEYERINSLNEAGLNQSGYLDFETGTAIEFSKRYYNVMWIGTFRNSFFRYDLSIGEFKKYNYDPGKPFLSDHTVRCILEDREGIVWVGTDGCLLRFNPETELIDKFTYKHGLPGNMINALVEDLQGNLWISTPGGLSKLNKNAPSDKWNFVNFDTRDGLQGYSVNQVSWLNKDGEIFFGGSEGINAFYPGKINTIPPNIVIEDIKISDVSLKTDSAVVATEKSVFQLEELSLSYDQNDISFDIAAIHFSRPAKNKIIYRLDGFSSNWISTDRNYASYTNLDPGEYVFRVRGANGDGVWDSDGRSLKIVISPPWWQTTPAYFGYFLALVSLVVGVDRFQRRRILTRERSAAAIKEAELRAQLAEAESARKSAELEEARQLQLSMLPEKLPKLPHLDIAVYMKTATEVGGDYYDFHVSLDGTLTVVIGDATGHGMKAGTMVTTAKTLFNSYSANPDILFSFHEMTRCIKLMNMGKLSMCMTMLKIQGNKMQMSSAGMPPSFIFRREERTVEERLLKGMPLGTMTKFPYEVKETALMPGDTILLLSDGLPELQNAHKEMFGYKRIRNAFEEVAEKSPESIVNYMKGQGSSWTGDKDPDDDVTFVVVKFK